TSDLGGEPLHGGLLGAFAAGQAAVDQEPQGDGHQGGEQHDGGQGVEGRGGAGTGAVVDLDRHGLGGGVGRQVADQHEVVDDVGEDQHRAGEDGRRQQRQQDVAQGPDRGGAGVHAPLPVLGADRQQPSPADDHRVGELEGDQPEQLGDGAQLDRLEQVGEQEQQGHGQEDLGEDERQQHLEVEAGGQAAPPAVEADGEGDPDGHGDQGGEHGQAEAVEQGRLEVGVGQDRQNRD